MYYVAPLVPKFKWPLGEKVESQLLFWSEFCLLFFRYQHAAYNSTIWAEFQTKKQLNSAIIWESIIVWSVELPVRTFNSVWWYGIISPSSVTLRLTRIALTWASMTWLGRRFATRKRRVRTPSRLQITALRENSKVAILFLGLANLAKMVPTKQAWIITPATDWMLCIKMASGHFSVVCRVPYPIWANRIIEMHNSTYTKNAFATFLQ